jgi:sec-independent protein translocase protein TatA
MPFGIGVPELLILLVVILLVFGPKRLPEMGRSLGRGMREFKDSISGTTKDDEDSAPNELTATGHEIVTPAPSEREKDAVS